MSSYISRIVHPISKTDIIPCGKFFCVCVEYLDFGNKVDVNRYKQCMITDIKNNRVPPPPFVKYRDNSNIWYRAAKN